MPEEKQDKTNGSTGPTPPAGQQAANSGGQGQTAPKPFGAGRQTNAGPGAGPKPPASAGGLKPSKSKGQEAPAKPKPVVLSESEDSGNLLSKLSAWLKNLRPVKESKTISQTNLVKDRAVVFIDWRHYLLSLLNSFLLALIILGMFYGYLLLLGERKMQEVRDNSQKLAELNKQIAGVEDNMDDVFSFQRKIKLVKVLISQHIYWTNFFAFLEKNTLPNVHYSSFNGSIDGRYKLKAQTDSFTSIANQLLILKQNPYVLTAKTNGGDISYDQVQPDNSQNEAGPQSENGASQESIMPPVSQSTVSFDLELNIKPDIFFE